MLKKKDVLASSDREYMRRDFGRGQSCPSLPREIANFTGIEQPLLGAAAAGDPH